MYDKNPPGNGGFVSNLGAVSIETAPFVFMLLDLQAAPLMHTLCAFETARSHIRTRC